VTIALQAITFNLGRSRDPDSLRDRRAEPLKSECGSCRYTGNRRIVGAGSHTTWRSQKSGAADQHCRRDHRVGQPRSTDESASENLEFRNADKRGNTPLQAHDYVRAHVPWESVYRLVHCLRDRDGVQEQRDRIFYRDNLGQEGTDYRPRDEYDYRDQDSLDRAVRMTGEDPRGRPTGNIRPHNGTRDPSCLWRVVRR
jgi:hypothetical protein